MNAHTAYRSAASGRMLEGQTLGMSHIFAGRVFFIGAVVLYRVVLDLCYIFYMNPIFGTHYLTPMPVSFAPIRLILSYVVLVIPSMFIPYDKRDFSGIFFLIILMFLYVPMTCMLGLDAHKSYAPIILGFLAITISFLVAKTDLTKVKLPISRNGERLSIIISYIFVMYFILYSVITGAIANINFDLTKIYEYRELSETALDYGVFSYFNLWTQKIFNPFLLAIGIYRKNKLMVIGAIAVQIFFFAVTQHRSHLFLPIIIYLASQLYVRRLSIPGLFVWSGLLLGVLLVATLSADLQTLPALIIRRAFFVPASITFGWVNFFSGMPKIHWSDGLLGTFIHSQYNGESIPWYIGYYVSHGTKVAYNDGLIGTGFAQAGYLGVILYALILGFVVKVINTMIHSGLPAFLPAALLFGPVRIAWADADVLTALLSHGIFIGIIVLWLYGSQNANQRLSRHPLGADATQRTGRALQRPPPAAR